MTSSRSRSESVQVVQEEVGVLLREAQLLRVDLGQLAAGAQAGERERRLGTAREDELERSGEGARGRKREALVDLRVPDQVVVVEHEHDRVRQRRELVEERRQYVVDDAGPRSPQHGKRDLARARVERAKRMDEVGPEPDRVTVAAVERDPGERSRLALELVPVGEQRRLPPPGGGTDQRQLARRAGAELEKVAARDAPARDGGLQLRLDERARSLLDLRRGCRHASECTSHRPSIHPG